MGTPVIESPVATTAITLPKAGEIVGPGTPFDVKRSAMRTEYGRIIVNSAELKEITTPEDAEKATQFGRLLQAGKSESEKFFKTFKQAMDELKKPILEAERADVGALDTEKARLGSMLTKYNQECEKKRQEEERVAREAAEKEAAAAREIAEKEARDAQIQQAIELEASGQLEAAAEVLEQPVYVEQVFTPVVAQSAAVYKPAGTVGRTNYTAGVEDWEDKMMDKPDFHKGWANFRILVKAVAEGKAPLRALLPNDAFIAAKGRNEKEGFSLPGCKVSKTSSTNFRS